MPRRIVPFLLLWLFVGVLHAQLKPEPAQSDFMEVLDDRHILVPGDTVSIRLIEDRRDVVQFKIPQNGMIQVRYVGAVKAEGMTCRKLAMLIRQKLAALPAYTLPFTYSEAPTVTVALDVLNYGPIPSANLKNIPKRITDEQPLGASLLTCMEILDNSRSIEAGDALSLRILEDRRPAVSLKVLATGDIEAPYVGKIKAAGQTSMQLAYQLKSKLQKRFFFRFPFFRKPILRKATVIVCIDKLTHQAIVYHCH
jgi:protein involved in polysaccharide export with SLBB domain